jgi:hydantoinase/carbamoylase family amidase
MGGGGRTDAGPGAAAGPPHPATADAAQLIGELRALAARTSDEHGAQRVAWTDGWAAARAFLRDRLAELPVRVEVDEAANLWATLDGESERALIVGSHLDSVPDGGWLDGCLGVLAGLEVMRRLASGPRPPLTVRLVDWADEEGARFGHSLFGSSAVAGTLELDEVRALRDRDGIALADALASHGVDLERMAGARRRLDGAAAYVELHIEQGPLLERRGLALGVVTGTNGIERHAVRFTGEARHAGTTPMDARRDALAGAARLALEVRALARDHGALATVGRIDAEPGVPTAVAEAATVLVDQRHEDAERLAALFGATRDASERIAAEEGLEVEWSPLFRVAPTSFDERLVELASEVVGAAQGEVSRQPSGALHDAAQVAGAGVPTVMLFVRSRGGISHTREEDSDEDDLALALGALDALVAGVLGEVR